MKVLMCGDTHGSVGQIRHLLSVAWREGCDRIMVLGDFGFWEHTSHGRTFLDAIDKFAALEKIPVYFIDGNHDKTSLLLARYGHDVTDDGFIRVRDNVLYAPRGLRWDWAGTRFIALGGAYSVDKAYRLALEAKERRAGHYWFPEEEMTDEDMAKILLDSSPVDIILAHDKPRASNPGWNRKDFIECWPNQDRLQMAVLALQPSLFLHGHLHWRYTDEIRTFDEEDNWCRVEAFTPDPGAGERGYRREDSRGVLHVEEKRIEMVP